MIQSFIKHLKTTYPLKLDSYFKHKKSKKIYCVLKIRNKSKNQWLKCLFCWFIFLNQIFMIGFQKISFFFLFISSLEILFDNFEFLKIQLSLLFFLIKIWVKVMIGLVKVIFKVLLWILIILHFAAENLNFSLFLFSNNFLILILWALFRFFN